MAGRVRVIIQARMGSSRLPGKVLKPLAGRPLLWHVVQRLQSAAGFAIAPGVRTWEVTVATTTAPPDDAIEQLCLEMESGCFRGTEDDVLSRYVAAAADLAGEDTVVRATADNPLYCPERTASIVAEHLQQHNDYTCIENLSYVVPEVMQVAALRQMAAIADDRHSREHVTPFFRQKLLHFRVGQLPRGWRGLRPEIRLTVDTPEELHRMQRLFEAAGADSPLFPVEEAYELNGWLDVAADSRRVAPAASRGEQPRYERSEAA